VPRPFTFTTITDELMLLLARGFLKVIEDTRVRARRAPDHDVLDRIEMLERPGAPERAPHADGGKPMRRIARRSAAEMLRQSFDAASGLTRPHRHRAR
jgi:hypothetical protein